MNHHLIAGKKIWRCVFNNLMVFPTISESNKQQAYIYIYYIVCFIYFFCLSKSKGENPLAKSLSSLSSTTWIPNSSLKFSPGLHADWAEGDVLPGTPGWRGCVLGCLKHRSWWFLYGWEMKRNMSTRNSRVNFVKCDVLLLQIMSRFRR